MADVEPDTGGRFLVRPRWILFHLGCAGLVALMLNLSLWQFHRLDERRTFNESVIARGDVEPVDVLELDRGADTDVDELEWRRAGARGTYVAGEQIVLLNRSQGGVAGYDVVTPLLLDSGSVVLVNRGFLPLAAEAPDPPTGPVDVLGTVRDFEAPRTGQAGDPPGERTEFFRLDYGRMDDQIDQPLVRFVIDLLVSDPADDPALEPVAAPSLGEGPHLSYAIQWIIFSIAVLVGWILAVRRSVLTRARVRPSA